MHLIYEIGAPDEEQTKTAIEFLEEQVKRERKRERERERERERDRQRQTETDRDREIVD